MIIPAGFEHNYSYYPILLRDEAQLIRVKQALNARNINPRRYFYPSLNTLPFLGMRQVCPVSENISLRALCLPLYEGLESEDVKQVVNITTGAM